MCVHRDAIFFKYLSENFRRQKGNLGMLGTTVQTLVALATWRPGSVHCNVRMYVYIYISMFAV